MPAKMRLASVLLLLGLVGCEQLAHLTGLGAKPDPIVGTWRPVESLCSSKDNKTPTKCDFIQANMVLRSDGSVVYLYPVAPDAGAEYNAARTAQAQVPGTYRHGTDTLVLTSYPKRFRTAFIAAGGHATQAPKDESETSDMILKYRLDADILETTWHMDDAHEFTTVDKYVRVK